MLGPTLPPELSQCNDVHLTKASHFSSPMLWQMTWNGDHVGQISLTSEIFSKKDLHRIKEQGLDTAMAHALGQTLNCKVGDLRTKLSLSSDTMTQSTPQRVISLYVEHITDLRTQLSLSLTSVSGAVAPPASYSSGQGTK